MSKSLVGSLIHTETACIMLPKPARKERAEEKEEESGIQSN